MKQEYNNIDEKEGERKVPRAWELYKKNKDNYIRGREILH